MVRLSKKITKYGQNESEDLFGAQCILDSIPLGVAIFDKNMELIQWNNKFPKYIAIDNAFFCEKIKIEELFLNGQENETVKTENANTLGLITEMFREGVQGTSFNWVYSILLRENKSIEINVEFFPKKGLVISLKNTPKTKDHQLIEFQAAKEYLETQTRDAIHMAEDLAVAQQEAAKSSQHVQTILNAMEEGLVTMNSGGTILSANNAMSVIFGYIPSEFEGKHLHNLIDSKKLQTSADAKKLLSENVDRFNVYKSDEIGVCIDGSTFPLKIDIREVYLGTEKHYTVLFRNVTEQ